jgi:maltose alpha-D-glucosyltransferase / alpha-amylase
MMQYGDEIGIGDDLRLPEREAARTPMQWTTEKHGGFSRAQKVVRPVINDATYGYQRVNVMAQRRDPESLLNLTERFIRARKECREISWGDYVVLRTNAPEVLALRYDWRDTALLTLHNFGSAKRKVRVKLDCRNDDLIVDVFDHRHSRKHNDGAHRIDLDGHGWAWYTVGSADNSLDRSTLDLTNPMR